MPLTLEQYASFLDGRDLVWPEPPRPKKAKARPHLVALPQVRVVTWNIYGTLLNLKGGELLFTHPDKFVMDLALDKAVQEFKMWGSMSRKPGQPAEYMGQIYQKVLDDQRLAPSPGEKYPEIQSDRIWEAILKKLMQKDYQFDATFYGSLNDYCRKIAYFFHASLQGTACYPGAAAALEHVKSCGFAQGLIADGQCFTLLQLQRGLAQQHCGTPIDLLFDSGLRALSFDQRGRKPSEKLFKPVLQAAAERGFSPLQILHIGSRLAEDIAPARKLGMRTGLFAGDKGSVRVTPEQLKDPANRPDVLLTDLQQITEILPCG
jgi:FMN phosphatase YigB (HAD superfamily)